MFDNCSRRLLEMKFKKGDKVEVMNSKEVPVSWHPAEILYGRGNTYHIRYDFYSGMGNNQMVEIVSGKFVRPFPPLVQDPESFTAGGIVEVFHENSWKIGVILKILRDKLGKKNRQITQRVAAYQNPYLVRLLGSLQELAIDQLHIRMRHIWCEGKWILMEKHYQDVNDLIINNLSAYIYCKQMNFEASQFDAMAEFQPKKDCMKIQGDAVLRKSPIVSTRSLKRISHHGSSIAEAPSRNVHKFIGVEKECPQQRVTAAPELEKVDAVAYPDQKLGEKNMHASFNIISNGYNQTKRTNQNDVLEIAVVRRSELCSSDTDACSVGSCSANNQSLENCHSHFKPTHLKDLEILCSDAESSNALDSRKRYSLASEEVDVNIRRLELHAYRCTMQALFASGPLSWDQEALLTNLRIMLHISNDEHLKEGYSWRHAHLLPMVL